AAADRAPRRRGAARGRLPAPRVLARHRQARRLRARARRRGAPVTAWDGRRVLVTGAGGFIGSHLTERLVELGASVRALVEYNAWNGRGWLDQLPCVGEIQVIAGDVTDRDSVRQAMQGADTVFHLAALIAIPYSYVA